jgi:hypothetical protein
MHGTCERYHFDGDKISLRGSDECNSVPHPHEKVQTALTDALRFLHLPTLEKCTRDRASHPPEEMISNRLCCHRVKAKFASIWIKKEDRR